MWAVPGSSLASVASERSERAFPRSLEGWSDSIAARFASLKFSSESEKTRSLASLAYSASELPSLPLCHQAKTTKQY